MQTRIVGRDGELEFIESRIDAARESQGSVILVAGEAGIGKSRLVDEILTRERDRPLYCAVGQCYEYLQTPFGPFSDMFARMESADLAAFADDPDVREVVEELTSTRSRSEVLERFDKRQLFRALSRAFESLAARSPLLVAIDDVQWADQSTLELLQFLTAAAPRNRIVLLLTYRSREGDQSDVFRGALAQLSRGPDSHTRSLGPLSDEDIRSMLRAGGESNSLTFTRLISTVSEHAEGNPLFAEELLKSATSEDPSTGELPLPLSVREAVLGRVARLSADDRRCISCASAIGRRFSPALLARIVDLSLEDVLSAIATATQEHIIEADADGRSFRFHHELTRRSIYEELPPITARLLHEQVAHALESEPASPVADLAYHYWMSADSVKAADFNEHAGNRARTLFAYPEALAHYDRALASVGDVKSVRVAVLEENRGRCLYQVGSSDAALAAYESARAYYESQGMKSDAARLCMRLASLRWGQGGESDGIAECRRTLELIDENDVAYFQAHAYLGYFMLDRDGEAAFQHFESAERYTGPRAREDEYIFHQCRALARSSRGDVEGTIADFRRPAEIALQHGDYALAIRCLGNLGHRLTDLGERDRALRFFGEAAQIMEREELWGIDCAVMLRQYAWANLQFGELAEAHRLIVRALTFPFESSRLRIFAAQAAMLIGLRTLDDALVAQVDDPTLLADALEPGNESTLVAALAFAERDLILGRTDEGRDILHRVVRAYAAVKQARDDDGGFVLVAQYGSDEDAATAREFVQRFHDETRAPVAKARLSLYDGVLAGRRGDREAAKSFANDAFEIYHALGWRWHEARALEFSGKLKEAMRAYDVAGDARSTARLRDALNPVNRQGRAASDLTKREGEIARLAVDGKTNREIAEALHVSPRTVETHLATIFGKLSVRTRAELIAKWRDLAPVGRQVSSRSRRH